MLNEKQNKLQHQGFGVRYSKFKKRKNEYRILNTEYRILNERPNLLQHSGFGVRHSKFKL